MKSALVILAHLPRLSFGSAGYYGANNAEMILQFSGRVEFYQDQPMTQAKILDKIHQQIRLTVGPLRREALSASYHPDYTVHITRSGGNDLLGWAEYDFNGRIAANGKLGSTLAIDLIHLPDGAEAKAGQSCYDESDSYPFWYYWNPKTKDCRLKENEDFTVIQAKVERLPSSGPAFPHYSRLVENGAINVHAFFGPDKFWNADLDFSTSRDIGTREYRRFRKALKKKGYAFRRWSTAEIAKIHWLAWISSPLVEEATLVTPRAKIVVRMFLGQTFAGNPIGNFAFLAFLRDALRNASLLLYSGHAGIGYNLNQKLMEFRLWNKVPAPPNRYQIFHLATCMSYTYYAQMFFDWKKTPWDPTGSQNLDLLGYAGGETLFRFMSRDLLNTLNAVQSWAETGKELSYQEILSRVESEPFLLQALGLEDNVR